jgi:RHS repeat-associated protein
VPWDGSPNIIYLGQRNSYIDGGAIRLDNPSDQDVVVQNVTVHEPNHNGTQVYSLWGTFTIPAHFSVILTQTRTPENFDTSDFGIPGHGCGQYAGPNEFPPEIDISLGNGESGSLFDRGHILDTGGFDGVCLGNESHGWQAVGILGGNQQATVFLSPPSQPAQVNTSATVVADVTDASNLPLANVQVDFAVTSGPNNGSQGSAFTDSQGLAGFSYTGTTVGTDTLQASVTNVVSGTIFSNNATVAWQTAPLPTNTPTRTSTPTATPTTAGQPTATPIPTGIAIPGWIGGPASGSTVSGTVPIILGQGVTLSQGQVVYYPSDNTGDVTVLNPNAQGGPGSTIATLDTTTLASQSYIVQLIGTDSNNNQLTSAILVTVVGENKPGRLTFSVTDLVVPLTGLPIAIGRTYDSLERDQSEDFGHGWKLSVGSPHLEVDQANNVTLTQPGGRRVTFFFQPQSYPFPFNFLRLPHYTPEAGVHGDLISDGCSVLVSSGGSLICFPDATTYHPTAYQYTDPSGQAYTMGADGSLRTIRDRTGNTITFTPNGITSSVGNANVPFVRDGQGRITQITDPLGHVYQYSYNNAGDLVNVNLPGVTNPITYTYDSSHLVLSGIDPRGNSAATTSYYPDGRLQSITDSMGQTTHYSYDLASNTTTITNPDGGVTVSQYNGYGLLTNQTDALGHTTSYQYDAARNLTDITDPLNHTTHFTYDAQGNRTSMTDPLNHSTHYTFDQYGNPLSITDPLNSTQTISTDYNSLPVDISDSLGSLGGYTWDAHGNPLSRYDGMGRQTLFSYDQYGNKTAETDPLGATTGYTYDALGDMLTQTDPLSNTTTFQYDPLGRLITQTDPLGNVTHFEYDFDGNQTAQVDALGRRTTYTYDADNRLTRVTYPDTTTQTYTYDFRGNVLTQTDQSGHVTTYTYDLAGQLTSVTYADGTPDASTTHYTYDAAGRKTSETDGLGHTTTFQYDDAGRLTSQTDPLNHATSYEYDAANRLTAQTDPDGHRTTFTYDVRGRQTATTYPDTTSEHWTYDADGNAITYTDQAAKTTSYSYDDVGRLTLVVNPLNQWTVYAWDPTGHLQSTTDANGRQTSYAYDAIYRNTRKTLPDGSFESYGYDPVGNRLATLLTDGHTNSFQYDALNRMTQTAYFDGQTVNYTYTPTGKRATAVDARGTTTYQYDNLDRVVRVTQPGSSQSVSYTYDAASRRSSLTTTAGTTSYGYDNANHLTGVTDPQGRATGYVYDPAGLRTRLNLPNGVQVDYGYDTLNRLTGIVQHKGLQQPMASYAYTLGPAGNRVSVTQVDGSHINWSYDDAYRLTGETMTDAGNNVTRQTSYSYDPVGNRTTMTLNGQTTAYTYNNLDQLTNAGGTSYQYDGRGNLTQIGTGANAQTFTYDDADRLTSATGPGGSATYAYDADGRRVKQTSAGAVTNYLWDELSANGDVVLETNGSGSILASYVVGPTYDNRGQPGSACGGARACSGSELISQTRGGTVSFYLQDAQEDVRALTDISGNVTDRYNYDAFGLLFNQQGNTLNPYRYADQQFDALTGLYSLRARYYSPTTGRFLTRDTMAAPLNDPIELDRYAYARDNPVNHGDPTGLAVAAPPIPFPRPVPLPRPVEIPRAALEYALLLMIAIIAIPAIQALGEAIKCIFTKVASVLMALARCGSCLEALKANTQRRCRIAICEFSLSRVPNIGRHILDAQNAGYPMLLTRTTDPAISRANRRAACGGFVRTTPTGTCDEYPFATTLQGGAGASTREVPKFENDSQGGTLSQCYSRENIGNGDSYAVVVVP